MYEITVQRYIIISRTPPGQTFCLRESRSNPRRRGRERERETEGREFLIFIGLQTGEIRPAEDPKTRLRLTLDGHERNARRTRRGTLVSSPRFFVPRYRTSFARRPAAARLVTGNGRKRESNGDFTIGVGRWVRSKRYDIA